MFAAQIVSSPRVLRALYARRRALAREFRTRLGAGEAVCGAHARRARMRRARRAPAAARGACAVAGPGRGRGTASGGGAAVGGRERERGEQLQQQRDVHGGEEEEAGVPAVLSVWILGRTWAGRADGRRTVYEYLICSYIPR